MFAIKEAQNEIENNIKRYLDRFVPNHHFKEVYQYSLLPAGKLFRPLLVRAIGKDFQNHNHYHLSLEAFVEIHHVYTLMHDDLPCMDDDKTRRGRPSSHIKFNEWKALLGGDGLLNLSFHLISYIQCPTYPLLKYLTWATGPKGLIYGQVKDLSLEMTMSFNNLIETHRLKTSRLIQCSLVGSAMISKAGYKQLKDIHRLGEHLGVAFQLLDDLCELKDEELSKHEAEVNPFFKFSHIIWPELVMRLEKIEELCHRYELENVKAVLKNYFKNTYESIIEHKQTIQGHIGKENLIPVVNILDRLSFANNAL